MAHKRAYSVGEEVAHAITHGAGAIFFLGGLIYLIIKAVSSGDPWRVATSIVYGSSLVLLYTISTLYHSFTWPRVKAVFQTLDHAAIYVLIAGSYTPFALVTLRGSGGEWMCALLWTIAIAGILSEVLWANRPRWLSVIIYLGMGWISVVMIKPMLALAAPQAIWLLIAGGLSYTIGTLAYMSKRVPYLHAVWHGFVFMGSLLHFLAIAIYVI
ncbi:MAG: hemolysin III family protein [Actinomycetota bacterium]